MTESEERMLIADIATAIRDAQIDAFERAAAMAREVMAEAGKAVQEAAAGSLSEMLWGARHTAAFDIAAALEAEVARLREKAKCG